VHVQDAALVGSLKVSQHRHARAILTSNGGKQFRSEDTQQMRRQQRLPVFFTGVVPRATS
jgi:hypothetical protein